MSAPDISIIIPIGPRELSWQRLARSLPPGIQVIWSIGNAEMGEFRARLDEQRGVNSDIIVNSEPGRAAQLNRGAEVASNETLWFLHADSELFSESATAVASVSERDEEAIWYFDLVFMDGSWAMKLNQWGVWFRSRLLKLPFGDQGLVLSRSLFFRLGGFPNEKIGEDLVFVRRAYQSKMSIKPLHARLGTSARKYASKWVKTTCLHLYWTVKLIRYADSSPSQTAISESAVNL